MSKTRTLDDTTEASDPVGITLSHKKLRQLRPDLYGWRGSCHSLLSALRIVWPERIYIAEQLLYGDSRAAVVVSTAPLLIAAYTDELDCVAILRFPEEFIIHYSLFAGTRLLTINSYDCATSYAPDLIPGSKCDSWWTNFHPIIAEFVTDDLERVESRKQQIDEEEWERAYSMGKLYVYRHPGTWRDGRPVHSAEAAEPIQKH